MKNVCVFKKILLSFVLLAGVSACVIEQPPQAVVSPVIKGAPDWVNRGSNVFVTQDGRMFYGVASASPMGDLALQKATADDRARAEVGRVLTSYLDVLSNEYVNSARIGEASGKNLAPDVEAVSRQIKSTSRANMAGARIIGSWRDTASNTIWSISELDMRHVKSALMGVKDMNADLKRYLDASADNVFDNIVQANYRRDQNF